MESGRAVPPELEGSIRALSERLDRMQLSQGDQLALGSLEDRIAKLSEKLDASDARLGHLDAIERGMADLLVHLEEHARRRAARTWPRRLWPSAQPAPPLRRRCRARSQPSRRPAEAAATDARCPGQSLAARSDSCRELPVDPRVDVRVLDRCRHVQPLRRRRVAAQPPRCRPRRTGGRAA